MAENTNSFRPPHEFDSVEQAPVGDSDPNQQAAEPEAGYYTNTAAAYETPVPPADSAPPARAENVPPAPAAGMELIGSSEASLFQTDTLRFFGSDRTVSAAQEAARQVGKDVEASELTEAQSVVRAGILGPEEATAVARRERAVAAEAGRQHLDKLQGIYDGLQKAVGVGERAGRTDEAAVSPQSQPFAETEQYIPEVQQLLAVVADEVMRGGELGQSEVSRINQLVALADVYQKERVMAADAMNEQPEKAREGRKECEDGVDDMLRRRGTMGQKARDARENPDPAELETTIAAVGARGRTTLEDHATDCDQEYKTEEQKVTTVCNGLQDLERDTALVERQFQDLSATLDLLPHGSMLRSEIDGLQSSMSFLLRGMGRPALVAEAAEQLSMTLRRIQGYAAEFRSARAQTATSVTKVSGAIESIQDSQLFKPESEQPWHSSPSSHGESTDSYSIVSSFAG